MTIQQAIFTSAQTERGDGYQVVAASESLDADANRELSVWCPSHDALLENSELASSVNFHPLANGMFCISRTTLAGAEYSGRGGGRVYTHCLITPSDIFSRFASNPFSICRAAIASGATDVMDPIPAQLPTLSLAGRASVVDERILTKAASELGVEFFARALSSAVAGQTFGIVHGPRAELLAAALFTCLPLAHRREISLTTGLRFSQRRAFRWSAVGDDPTEQRQLQRRFGMQITPSEPPAPAENVNAEETRGWGRFVVECLKSKRLSVLEHHLQQIRENIPLPELDKLGDELLRQGVVPMGADFEPDLSLTDSHCFSLSNVVSRRRSGYAGDDAETDESTVTEPLPRLRRPSTQLSGFSPDCLPPLEALEEAIYKSIGGGLDAQRRLGPLWKSLLSDFGRDRADELREVYLRFALEVWNQSRAMRSIDPKRAIATLDVINILIDEMELATTSLGP